MKFFVAPTRIGGIGGQAAYARYAIAAGEHLCTLAGKPYTRAQMLTRIAQGLVRTGDDPLEIGIDMFLQLDDAFLYFNHSCEPTACVRGRNELYALRDFDAGDEITFDYSLTVSATNPWWMTVPCACAAASCRGQIGNVTTVPLSLLCFYDDAGALQDHIRTEVFALRRSHGRSRAPVTLEQALSP